jgi:hypothetical protein
MTNVGPVVISPPGINKPLFVESVRWYGVGYILIYINTDFLKWRAELLKAPCTSRPQRFKEISVFTSKRQSCMLMDDTVDVC